MLFYLLYCVDNVFEIHSVAEKAEQEVHNAHKMGMMLKSVLLYGKMPLLKSVQMNKNVECNNGDQTRRLLAATDPAKR